MKKIAISLSMIAFVAMMAVGATGAYFSDSKIVGNNTFATGTVDINNAWQAPITIAGLYPGAVKTADFSVKYDGSIKGDLYFGFKVVPGHVVLGSELQFQIEKINASDGLSAGFVYGDWVSADFPYGSWTKIASGLNKDQSVYYKVHVKMIERGVSQDGFQGMTAYNDIVLYAVQENGPSPATPPATF
jgi:predicted ribosomally synthesized peptide with SipW-like signal peptide